MSPLSEQLAAAAASHSDAITVLAQFVDKTHMLLVLESPRLRDPNEAARSLRLSPALLSTLSTEQVAEHQESVKKAVQQERDHQEQIKAITQEFPGLLMRMALIYRVGLFDAFISDIQLCVLTQQPELLKSDDRKLSYTNVVEAMMQNRLIERFHGGIDCRKHRSSLYRGATQEDSKSSSD